MKKFMAIMLSVSLILSCICVTHSFAAPLLSLTADMEGRFNSATGTYICDVSGNRTGFEGSHPSNNDTATTEFLVAGSAANKKYSSDQMLMAQLYATNANGTWNRGKYRPRTDISFAPGQQIYMRAQYYLPSKSYQGDSYASYNDNFSVSMIGNYLDSKGSSISLNLLTLQTVDSSGGNFYFAGDKNTGFEADEVWKYDTWYTIEAIVTAGDSAVVSVYVNGIPLTFENQSFTDSLSYNTGVGCAKISESHSQKSKQWFYCMGSTNMKDAALKRHMYTDNWAFEVYPASETITLWTPPEYNPVSFTAPCDGDEMRTNEFESVTIDTTGEECDWVELYIDDEPIGSDAQAPYSFELSKRYDPGEHTLRAVAKSDTDTYERSIDITLTEFNPLSFEAVADGDEVYDKKFKTITIDTEDEPCEYVSLYIDDELIETKTSAPYVFNLSDTLSIGNHALCAKATVGTTEYESEIDIKVLAYNPLSFAGIADGGKVSSGDFKSVTVLTGNEIADEVSLYVDGKLVGTLTAAPFSFELSDTYTPGAHSIRAVAAVGSDTYELIADITLLGTYDKSVMNQNFDAYASFLEAQNGGWYQPSSRMHNAKSPNGWFIKPVNVEDKNGAAYGQAFSLGCDPGSPSSYVNQSGSECFDLTFGYCAMTDAPISGNKVKIEWYSLFNKDVFSEFAMGIGSGTGSSLENQLFQWDTAEKKIKWNVAGYPLTAIETNKWQKYVLTIDMADSSKMSLSVDGVPAFSNITPNAAFASFSKVIWRYVPDCSAGSYVALDEVKITHIIPRPSFGTAKFYVDSSEATDAAKVSPLTNAIAINVEGGLIDANLAENVELLENGKVIKAVDSLGNQLKPAVMLSGTTLWLVPHVPLLPNCEYSVKLAGGAMFENNVEIGYDQYFNFTTGKGSFEINNASFTVNGSATTNVANGDFVGADVRISNTSGEAKPVKLLLALYSGGKLMSISVKPVTVASSPSTQTISANDATVRAASDFSASLIVLDANNYPIAQCVMGE